MKLEMTPRDIWLLKLAGSALIVFFMVSFCVMPGIERYQEHSILLQELQETRESMETSIEEIPLLEQSVEKQLEELKEESTRYYEKMENRQVDELLTGLALEHGLFPVSLSISDAAPQIPEMYLYGQQGQLANTGEKTDAEQGSQSETTAEGNSQTTGNLANLPGAYMLTGSGTMVLRGNRAQILAWIDEIREHEPGLKLRSLRMSEQVYLDAGWDVAKETQASITVDVYMYDWDTVAQTN